MLQSLRPWAAPVVLCLAFAGISRGAVVSYQGTLGPEAVGATGSGSALVDIDTVAHTLRVQATFSGLSGTTTASHIHAPTAVAGTGNAGVATQLPSFTLFPLGVSAGSFDQTLDTSQASSWNPSFITANGGTPLSAEAALATFLAEGRSYLNIHSNTFTGGEIRAYLTLVPEPTTGLAALLGVGLIVCRRPRPGRGRSA